jgi:hypothetical protein
VLWKRCNCSREALDNQKKLAIVPKLRKYCAYLNWD